MRLIIFTLMVCLAWGTPTHAAGLFGFGEYQRNSLRVFVKWTGIWPRAERQKADQSTYCPPKALRPCGPQEFESILSNLPAEQGMEQLNAVNLAFNRMTYITDPINWGVPDFWATVYEFLSRDGDCEDYAIAKYAALKRLGVPPENMRIVVVDDLNLQTAHAVLMVEMDDQRWILDNQVNVVLPDTAIHHYRPIYSINETAWWQHAVRR
ncbi:MAG: transglutaminase-like cysteine peptidase [Sphingomonadales bacterium]|jgi:predicted transglutaminase-like cysteine proteinase